MSEWSVDHTEYGNPSAVLKDKDKIIAKVYLSPNQQYLRIVLPEFIDSSQVTFKPGGIIDLRRKL